ncbi:MAG TPA: hypothetical protein VJB57_13945 [Dehalococcoidia bacterium]|nr:hypothetical protein [Dehalococcoidia bacterium]
MPALGAELSDGSLRSWCKTVLGSEPAATLFKVVHLSSVVGLRLTDGREVVVKARPYAERFEACFQVQLHLWEQGYPCPQPLVGPALLDGLALTAEAFVPGGTQLEPGPDSALRFASALAQLVGLAPSPPSLPSLAPQLPWVGWDYEGPGIWPAADDLDDDLNSREDPTWLDELGTRVRLRFLEFEGACVVGHGDWESQNLRWLGRELHVVHDWDSVAAMPEPMLAGAAGAIYTVNEWPLSDATIEETAAFLEAYEEARRERWNADARQVFWATGLWVKAFNAKKETFRGNAGPALQSLAQEAEQRLELAGA